MKMQKIIIGSALILFSPNVALAHPGNTAADGCHYCRTNCDKWGEAWDERHCHGGSDTDYDYYEPPKPRCPANSVQLGTTCYCNDGYAPFQTSCIKIPENAHGVDSATDAWECDTGYIEKGNTCILKPKPVASSSPASISSSAAPQQSSSLEPINTSSSSLPLSVEIPEERGFWGRFWSFLFGS